METFLQFAVLGLGSGSAYAVASLGLVQVYRGSGVLNLAHGAIAYAAAAVFIATWRDGGWPLVLAVPIAIGVASVLGLLIEVLVMGPLRSSAPLVRMTATLGVFAVLQQGTPLILGEGATSGTAGSFYPAGAIELGAVRISYDRLVLLAIVLGLGVLLSLLAARTHYGLATSAVAENEFIASTMGVGARRTAALNWALGGALAGAAGVLLLPVILVVTAPPLLFLVVPALAASMIGRFSSIPLTIGGALGLGMGESLLVRYQSDLFPDIAATGWDKALPFLVIVALLAARGTPFPERSETATALPRVRSGRASPALGLVVTAVAALAVSLAGDDLAGRISSSAALAIVGVSLVVVIGFAGQTSLAQMALAGVGALVAARISEGLGWPFPVVMVLAMLASGVVGALVALPSLRTRGPTLAIATLGLGIAIEQVVLTNGRLTLGGFSGTPVERPTLLGLEIDAIDHPQRFAVFTVAMLGLVCVAVSVLRSGRVGRRLLAVRGSERAAASLGAGVGATKVGAFAVASAIAGLGGVLLAFRGDTVTYGQFGLLPSLNLIVFATIGGIGFLLGPVVGALFTPNGLVSYLFDDLETLGRWIVLGSGILLILILIWQQDGLVGGVEKLLRRLTKRSAPTRPRVAVSGGEGAAGASLSVQGLHVSYGSVVALDELNLTVEPGQIVGLIGPNGAGKTTALDAISGFTATTKGSTSVGGVEITAARPDTRALAGLARSFQNLELFDDLTVAENLAVGHESVGWVDWLTCLFRSTPPEIPTAIVDAADSVGLDLEAHPPQMSQGQRRYLGVLRALATKPAVVLLDEPASGLTVSETRDLGSLLRATADTTSVGFLLVDHDMDLIGSICDRVVTLDFGRTIFEGTSEAAAESPIVRAAYVGADDAVATDV